MNTALGTRGKRIEDGYYVWLKGDHYYNAFNLDAIPRGDTIIHPVMHKMIDALTAVFESARENNTRVILCLPFGWDSHQHERAACGKCSKDDYWITEEESYQHRFTNEDFNVFYQYLTNLIHTYHANIYRVYWQLEGGYTRAVYEQQIATMVPIFNQLNARLGLGPTAAASTGMVLG